jgi:hypothetical protein
MTQTPTIRISNLNYAGFQLFLGFVVAPIMIVALIAVFVGGGMKDQAGQTNWPVTIVIGGMLFGGSLVLLFVALAKAILWIEMDDEIRYRTVAKTMVASWASVATLRFEEEQSRLGIGRGISKIGVPLGRHQILVIELSNGQELRAKVTREQEERVLEIAKDQLAAVDDDAKGGIRGKLPVRWEL